MKYSIDCYRYIFLIVLISFGYSCNKDSNNPPDITAPILTTEEISNVLQTTAVSGGDIIDDGGTEVSSRGVCWSTVQNPTIVGAHTSDGGGIGSYISVLSQLSCGTKYYVRAYATNSQGTAYGNELTFSSNQKTIATAVVGYASSITFSSATAVGNIKSDGGSPILERGMCWSTKPWPEISDNKSIDGTGTGTYTSTLTGLSSSALYYYRAYATNAIGTAYSVPNSFTTKASITIPDIMSEGITGITANSALGGGIILSEGGSAVTTRGICWSTSQNPNVSDNHAEDIYTKNSFRIRMNNLTLNTKYYARAYAVNSYGTSYGNQLVFITIPQGEVQDVDGNIYKTVTIGTQIWMTENLKTTKYRDGSDIPYVTDNSEWSSLISGAYCWYKNDGAKYKNLYGALYNWYTVNSGNLCPIGWHVPTDTEWTELTTFLGGNRGGKLKETGTIFSSPPGLWSHPNTDATNETGFSARPGGQRFNSGSFYYDGYYGNWWCSRESSQSSSWYRNMASMHGDVGRSWGDNRKQGYSVRCMKDN
jgi:uncharacterized protein (TIGR02145 family)